MPVIDSACARLSGMKVSPEPGHLPGRLVLVRLVVTASLIAVLAGCARLPVADREHAAMPVEAASASLAAQADRWWYVRFRLRLSPGEEVDSYLDTLIADQIVRPVIAQYRSDIALWRFHRRWPRDTTGHQFSFIFFAPQPTATRIVEAISADPLVAGLQREGLLLAFSVDPADAANAMDPGATSDPAWPDAIQREWPAFIQGASHMWLGLVHAEAARYEELELHARYRAVEAALEELWFKEANHAFFHHLSAIFGYKPVRILRRDIMTF